MKLPDTFEFKNSSNGAVYKATLEYRNYVISWDIGTKVFGQPTNFTKYPVNTVANYIQDGRWAIQPETFTHLFNTSEKLHILINEKNDGSDLTYEELKSLRLTRGLINRLLDDRS